MRAFDKIECIDRNQSFLRPFKSDVWAEIRSLEVWLSKIQLRDTACLAHIRS